MTPKSSTLDLASTTDKTSLLTIKPTSFTDLPTNVRLSIYKLAFSCLVDETTPPSPPNKQDKERNTSPYHSILALLHANRTVRLEVHATLLPLVSDAHYAACSSYMRAAFMVKSGQNAKASFDRCRPAAFDGVDPEQEEELKRQERQHAEAELRFCEMAKIRGMVMRVDDWLNRAR